MPRSRLVSSSSSSTTDAHFFFLWAGSASTRRTLSMLTTVASSPHVAPEVAALFFRSKSLSSAIAGLFLLAISSGVLALLPHTSIFDAAVVLFFLLASVGVGPTPTAPDSDSLTLSRSSDSSTGSAQRRFADLGSEKLLARALLTPIASSPAVLPLSEEDTSLLPVFSLDVPLELLLDDLKIWCLRLSPVPSSLEAESSLVTVARVDSSPLEGAFVDGSSSSSSSLTFSRVNSASSTVVHLRLLLDGAAVSPGAPLSSSSSVFLDRDSSALRTLDPLLTFTPHWLSLSSDDDSYT